MPSQGEGEGAVSMFLFHPANTRLSGVLDAHEGYWASYGYFKK